LISSLSISFYKVNKNFAKIKANIGNDFAYWRALNNRYWPAFYLIDKKGKICSVEVGEMHSRTARANKVEEQIQALLAEK
jgi:hypothetical protein